MSDHDDELGAFLRSEVPGPGPDYWDNIDAMLNRVESEPDGTADTTPTADTAPTPGTTPAAEPASGSEPARRHLSIAPLNSEQGSLDEKDRTEMQTGEDVTRLTDMTILHAPSLPRSPRRYAPMLVAAAVLAVVGLGTIFALNRNQPTTLLESANDGTPASNAPASGDDASEDDNEDGAGNGSDTETLVDGVALPGSVWSYTVDELPRPLLSIGDNAEPFAGQIWIKPLVATGAEGTHVDQTWVEFEGLGEPNVWLPLSAIEPVADGLPSIEPAEVTVVGIEAGWLLPDFDIEPTEAIAPGVTLTSTGFRSQADGTSWLLIQAEFPFFVPEDTVDAAGEVATGISAGRGCYSDGTVVLTIDVAADGSLTGWQVPVGFGAGIGDLAATELHLAPNGDRLLTLSGVATTGTDRVAGPYRVAESSIGALRNGFSTISTSQWIITDDQLTQPGPADEVRFPAVDCADSAEDLTVIEATPAYFPPDFPIGLPTISDIDTTPGQNRVCYSQVDGSGLLVFDVTDDGAIGNGLQADAFQTISATKTIDGENTYNVATLILGDQENGRDTITTTLWEITPERINLPFDGEELPAVDCATVVDQVSQAENFLGAAPYPAYPLGS